MTKIVSPFSLLSFDIMHEWKDDFSSIEFVYFLRLKDLHKIADYFVAKQQLRKVIIVNVLFSDK